MAGAEVLPFSEISFRFKVANISNLESVWSREVPVQDIPWKVKVTKKTEDGKKSLGIYLLSAKKDMPSNWSHAASATFKLLSFDSTVNALTKDVEPYVFTNNGYGIGDTIISWAELFDEKKHYVEDDAIDLEIKIQAEEPSVNNRSKLIIMNIDKFCECSSAATLRLKITNIKNLMAVQSSELMLRKLPWNLQVFKHSSTLGLRLVWGNISNAISCKTKMTVEIISLKNGVHPIEKVQEDTKKRLAFFYVHVSSWDELLNPGNGFVNNDDIEMEVKIETEKPTGDIPKDMKAENVSLKMECAICLEPMGKREISITPCGHLFCTACITKTITDRQICPTCNGPATLGALYRIYLPM